MRVERGATIKSESERGAEAESEKESPRTQVGQSSKEKRFVQQQKDI